ncbi:hypothetical protein [Stigmatella aurantiaca]|uniref:Uncharacterized protein n=1 Tax=Stigmatella aurantiaca (strain DW4/3-1) TaxID=378806 RepID=Q08UC4_STIAD|nr:hypothetical protein [Stigmatella aurantiaca]EAU64073.1 hypothetical protein STIAU_0039 [Stigmatella aurantiaca DW4/3-1]
MRCMTPHRRIKRRKKKGLPKPCGSSLVFIPAEDGTYIPVLL